MKTLAIRLERVKFNDLRETAADAIVLAGRLNSPVVFKFSGIELIVDPADCVRDVWEQYNRKIQYMTGEPR